METVGTCPSILFDAEEVMFGRHSVINAVLTEISDKSNAGKIFSFAAANWALGSIIGMSLVPLGNG